MPIFQVSQHSLARVPETTFAQEKLLERKDIQRLLCNDISAISDDLFVVCEEFSDWEEASRRIDILCIDTQSRLVVVEVKRTEDGGHMELQAVRYAAMVSNITFDRIVAAHARYLRESNASVAEKALLDFLGVDTTDEVSLGHDVRIILVSADFSTELTTAVLWLRKYDIEIRCVRLKPYRHGVEVLIDVQQIIPPPEAAEYEVKLRAQEQEERRAVGVRQEKLLRFWTQLIDQSKSRTQLVAGRSPTKDHWLAAGIGRTGFALNFTLTATTSRVECYIDMGKESDERNLELFNRLLLQRTQIESVFGAELEWQELNDSRGCRICQTMPGGWKSPESDWPAIQDRMIDAMIKLERALKPMVSALE